MIDSSKSPMPVWRRYGTAILLSVLLVVVGYVVYVKELHHSAPSLSSPAASSPAKTPAPAVAPTPPTTVPGGIPVSSRDPFSN